MRIIFFISFFFLISNCSFDLVDDHHGVFHLDKKEKRINVGKDNKNDIISYLGEPSTTSTFDNDVWIYVERKITNSHFFGRRKLIINNILILEIDDMEEIKYDNSTTASLQKRDFIYNFLSSMRQRINDPLGVRKKKREQGTR